MAASSVLRLPAARSGRCSALACATSTSLPEVANSPAALKSEREIDGVLQVTLGRTNPMDGDLSRH